jgi:DNA topoisomerase-1
VSTILDREYVLKEGKYLRITPLGEVVTDLMCQRFQDIVDVKFTARMEQDLDEVESGDKQWKDLLRTFYGPFNANLKQVEQDMEGVYLKVPDEVSEEKCDKCGRNMVIKVSKFGKFLACPGFPECRNTKPMIKDTGVKCPKCDGRIVERKSKKGKRFFTCEKAPECDFLLWDQPIKAACPVCGGVMVKKYFKKGSITVCSNPDCSSNQNKKTD